MTRWITTCKCQILLYEQEPEKTIVYLMDKPCSKHSSYDEKDRIKLGNLVAKELQQSHG